jgi:hypothetical protein
VLRRTRPGRRPLSASPSLRAGDLRLDRIARQAWLNDTELKPDDRPRAPLDSRSASGRSSAVISGVTPAEISGFYTSALPRAGYTITENNTSARHLARTAILFSGPGYAGVIGAATRLKISGISGLSGNVAGIALTPK